ADHSGPVKPILIDCLGLSRVGCRPILGASARVGSEEGLVKKVVLRLSGSLVVVLGLWTLVWLPLVLGQSSAAAPQEEALGDPNAPVTIIEYASLTCPHCAHFHKDVLPLLKERYIAPGKVRLVFRDFPLDQRALSAAILAHCAGPERYFGFLDVLFQTQ